MTDLPTTAQRWREADYSHRHQSLVQVGGLAWSDASRLADAMAAEHDPTPLTLDAIKAAGWLPHYGAWRKPGGTLEAWCDKGVVHLFFANMRLIENATLGDLRTLERILSKEPTR
jgi:hypothetical protein